MLYAYKGLSFIIYIDMFSYVLPLFYDKTTCYLIGLLLIGKKELREMVQQAKSEGVTINVRHAKILFCGASRAGKTSFSRLLRNRSYKNSESTIAGHTKQILITGKVNVVGSDWVSLDSSSETQALTEKLHLIMQYKNDTKDNKSSKNNTEQVKPDKSSIKHASTTNRKETTEDKQPSNQSIKDPTDSDNVDTSVSKIKEGVTPIQNSPPETDNKPQTISESMKGSQTDTAQSHGEVSVEEKMANIHFLDLKKSIPKTWDIFTILDTGGQPEFINMLPAINSSTAITFVIINLSDGKNSLSAPIIAKYDKKGYDYEQYKLGYSNKDLLNCLLSSVKVAALKKDDFHPDIIKKVTEDKHPKPVVYIIGTCADVLKAKIGERYDQEIKDIDKEIKKLVNSIKHDQMLVFQCNDSKRYINPIDNTVPRVPKDEIIHHNSGIQNIQRDTRDTISVIHERSNEILRDKAQYEIPISWFILELELRKNDKVCISLEDVQDICNKILPSHRQMKLPQIIQVLKFYHQYGMLLYFDEVVGMNKFVITNPQWLFINLTKIIMCKFEQNATNLYRSEIIERMENGICDMELFQNLKLDLQGIKLESFLNLLVHIKVIAPMDNGYFIPNILPLCANTESICTETECGKMTILTDDKENIKVEPLLVQFTFGTIPRGLFGFLVVEILQENSNSDEKYELYGENDKSNDILFRCANLLIFHVNPCFYISLIDKISYLELQVRSTNEKRSHHYKAQTRVTKALKKVCNRFDWIFNSCRYGFLCESKSKLCCQSTHLALLDPDKPLTAESATCKNHQSKKLNEAHHIWFKVS